MSGPIETKIIESLKKKFSKKYEVLTSAGKQETGLPKILKKDEHKPFYFPDIIFRDKSSSKIKYIIEIETDPVRKALVGAAITADYCISRDQPDFKPQLFFIIGKKGLNQLHNFQARIKIMDKYLKHIKTPIHIDDEKTILKILK